MQLFNDNCLTKLKELQTNPENTVIITSPPYNMNLRVRGDKYKSAWQWKGVADWFTTKYANYKDDLPMEDYYEFQREFLELALEKAHLVFYNIQMVTGNKVALFKLLGTFCDKIKEVIIWDKVHGQPAVRAGCMNSRFEFIFVLSNYTPTRRMFSEAPFERGTLDNVWQQRVGRHKGAKAGFPEELIETLITKFLPKGTVVIDPYMGSGTTGAVCKKLGYDFIGIELDPEVFKYAEERINEQAN